MYFCITSCQDCLRMEDIFFEDNEIFNEVCMALQESSDSESIP